MIAEKLLERVIAEGKVFKVGNSFFFAAQIPDDSVGCSGSRCSCCNGKVAYCNHVCKHCGLPFVGPCGFPQLPHWEAMSIDMRIDMVEMVFNQKDRRGRLEYAGVKFFPLTPSELLEVEDPDKQAAWSFHDIHGVYPYEIRAKLMG